MTQYTIPHNWEPRDYQMPAWDALLRGCRRVMLNWHRRAGKDLTAFNWAVFDMIVLNPGGQWWHVWPTYEQGRKGFWEGADNSGRRFMDYIPPNMIKRKREDLMMIELTNGSIYRIVGADDPSRLVGANPVGLIMTEYSLQNPAAWDYLRPILAANNGAAIFPFTPRGRNHAFELFKRAQESENWFAQALSIEDSGALPLSVLEEERESGMSEELIRQEYYCSFEAPLSGSYYADQFRKYEASGVVGAYPYDPNFRVETWWDIGLNDTNAIWFMQRRGEEYHFVDYEEGADKSLIEWIKVLESKPYLYSIHVGPHDLNHRDYGRGERRVDLARKHGTNFEIAPKLPVQDGIDKVRREFARFKFNEATCAAGIDALKAYRREWDSDKQMYRDKPRHDWASNGADAFRTGVVGTRPPRLKTLPKRGGKGYDPFAASRPYGRT